MQRVDHGVCVGIAYAVVLAALSPRLDGYGDGHFIGDLETFFKRLHFMMAVYQQDDFEKKMKQIKDKIINKQPITESERMYLDLQAFLERVNLFFQPQVYAKKMPTLFQHRKAPYSQEAEKVFAIAQSDSLIPKGQSQESGVLRTNFFTGFYDTERLKKYSTLLKEKIESIMSSHPDKPVTIVLKIVNHAIALAYQNRKWVIIDPRINEDDLEKMDEAGIPLCCVVRNADEMADKIATAFSRRDPLPENTFSTEIYVADAALKDEIQKGFNELMVNEQWRKIHPIDVINSVNRIAPHQSNQLTIAAKIGDVMMLRELMKSQYFRVTPDILLVALTRGHEEFVLLLLEKAQHIDLHLKVKNESGKLRSLIQIAEETHSQRVMIRIIECQLDDVKKSVPDFGVMASNVLNAFRLYLDERHDPKEHRETIMNNVLNLLHKKIKNCTPDNENEMHMETKKDILNTIEHVEKDHAKEFPTFIPDFLHGVAHTVKPSKLAKYLKEALEKSPAPPLLRDPS